MVGEIMECTAGMDKKKALLDSYADELRKERPARAAILAVRRFVESQLAPEIQNA